MKDFGSADGSADEDVVVKKMDEGNSNNLSRRVEMDLRSLIGESNLSSNTRADTDEVLGDEENFRLAEEFFQRALERVKEGDNTGASELFSKALEHRIGAGCAEDDTLAKWYYLYGRSLYFSFRSNAQVFGDKSDALAAEQIERLSDERVLDEDDILEGELESEDDESFVDEGQSDDESISEEGEYDEEEGEYDEDEDERSTRSGLDDQISEFENYGLEGTIDDENGKLDEEQLSVKGDVDEENEECKISDLEIAWEVLEISRLIYSNREDKKLALSDVHLLLGQICLEEEKLDLAVDEINTAIELRKQVGDIRAQAEAYFILGLVREMQQKDIDAIENLEMASSLIQKTIDSGTVSPEELEDLIESEKEIRDRINALKDVFTPAAEDEADFKSGKIPQMDQIKNYLLNPKGPPPNNNPGPVNLLAPRKITKNNNTCPTIPETTSLQNPNGGNTRRPPNESSPQNDEPDTKKLKLD